MTYGIIIVFKERNKQNEKINPFLSMSFIAGNLVIDNGYNKYDYPISKISYVEFEKLSREDRG
jgi:hypothetical protein